MQDLFQPRRDDQLGGSNRSGLIARIVSGAFFFLQLTRSRGQVQDQLDFKYQDYQEGHQRIHVDTYSTLLQQQVVPWLSLQGGYVYDTIAGNTPLGLPPASPDAQVPTVRMHDIRRAESISAGLRLGPQTITPAFTYSKESDYESYGLSLADSVEFNQKNTIVTFGASQDLDHVLPHPGEFNVFRRLHKNSTQGLVGLDQLLGADSVLTLNASDGYIEGFLNDPYRGIQFDDLPGTAFGENRPRQRFEGDFYLSISHFFPRIDGSIEGGYRYYEDSYGIIANTLKVDWLQNLGKSVVVSPTFRFYNQTAAYFYYPGVPAQLGDPQIPKAGLPLYYASDYRLSEFSTFTCGLMVTMKIKDHVFLDFAYNRYIMEGNDEKTSASMYPTANIFSIGTRLWW
jgi:hypothetical protein